jgi:3-oxocholest-4-en-26-oate---CoA ligase
VSLHLADLFEAVVDADPDREVLVTGGRRLTYRELDERANRLAHHLTSAGIGQGDHVGLQLLNGSEYLEGMLAAFKIRAVPVNVNYRYVEKELRYLYDDAGLSALIYHRAFAPRVTGALGNHGPKRAPLHTFVHVDDDSGETPVDGSVDYDDAIAAQKPERPSATGRSDDDLYLIYTGGTTGMPKGVVWRHEDIFMAAMGGGDPAQMGNVVDSATELAKRLPEPGLCALATPPLMHASAHWLAFHHLYCGGKIVLLPHGRFDAATAWELIGQERVLTVVVIGDAMAKPLLDELEAHTDRYDTSGLWVIASSGAALSQDSKDRLARLLPDRMVVDSFGSSETGVLGAKGGQGGATFQLNDSTGVVDEAGRPVSPGSGTVGKVARRGHVPLRYHNDPEKSAATFIEVDGERWAVTGDDATIEEDGTIRILGRGSLCINTGGEKVYPEEVEEPLRGHPSVEDALVVGVPDDRWGERVVAVVAPARGATPELEELQAHVRSHVAGYKVPRELIVVDTIERSPAGKADYRWAKERAVAELAKQ